VIITLLTLDRRSAKTRPPTSSKAAAAPSAGVGRSQAITRIVDGAHCRARSPPLCHGASGGRLRPYWRDPVSARRKAARSRFSS
jgi:hypothetical protein